ncbi:MAG TPA: sulfite exporter TauE/SafE family protein [Acidimicrobiales bacterium]
MLASITPLGERGRHNRWATTVTAYVAGSVVAATAVGAVLGLAGAALQTLARPGPGLVGGLAVAACALAAAFDAHALGVPLPSWHRQVNEDWLHRYRGWVYGVGFGAQLGVGVVTIVTTAAVYATLVLALLSGSAVRGALVGAVFGAVRALPVVAMGRIDAPDRLRRTHRTMMRLARPAEQATVALLILTAALVGVAAVA